MITRQITKTRQVAIVEVINQDPSTYKGSVWPMGKQLEVDLDCYKKGGIIKSYTAGHGISLNLFAYEVKPVRAFIEKTIIETEFFEI